MVEGILKNNIESVLQCLMDSNFVPQPATTVQPASLEEPASAATNAQSLVFTCFGCYLIPLSGKPTDSRGT